MNGFLYKTLIFSYLFFSGQLFYGQNIAANLVFDQLSKSQGLPDNSVNAIFQDSRGFLWLATNHGLSRYDSRNFKNYTTIGKSGISDLAVKCITEDKSGNIWFGTESGLNKLDPHTEAIIQYHKGTGPGTIPHAWCNYLFVDKENDLCLGTEKGLALFNTATNSFQNYPVTVYGKDERINKFINNIVDDGEGNLWLSTSFGIKAWNKKTKSCISYHKEEVNGQQQLDNIFYALFIDHNHEIWAGTFNGELFKFNKTENRFNRINIENVNKNRFAINDISEIKVQDRWYLILATTSGLISFESARKEAVVAENSMGGYYLSKIFTDRQQNLWVASEEGLFKLNPNSFAFKWIPVKQKGKATQRIYHIIPDIKNPQTVFYLTTQSGWYKYDVRTQTITPHVLPEDKELLLKNINSYINDGTGYWFTSVTGFGYYDIYKNRLLNLSQHTFLASGQHINTAIVKASETKYWIALKRSGILVFDRVTQKDTVIFGNKDLRDNMYGSTVDDMQMGIDGHIWFTGKNKLYRVDPHDFSYKTFSAPENEEQVAETKCAPYGICFTKSGRLLVCSHLRIYEYKNEKLVTVYPAKGFSNFSIEGVMEDAGNNLWVHAAETVYKTDSNFLHWESMNNLPGWQDGTSIQEFYTKLPGEILFASDSKMGVLHENLLQRTLTVLPVIISRVRYGEKEKYLVAAEKTGIKSSYRDALEIDLSPVNFIDEKENKILYQLRGWDDGWKLLAAVSTIRYEQLPPGNYTFSAKSVNAEGIESKETNIAFSVIPPFYRTWWFIVFNIIIVAIVIFLIYRYRLKKALELERIRTKIATDLHDDIGATLSSISLYSQVVKDQLKEKDPQLENVLDKMGKNSREMVASMSDIVWAINPENDDGDKLVTRMESYAVDMCALKNIRLYFQADEKLKSISLPPEHRKNCYLIFKEAVNNAVKYSGAITVWVQIGLMNSRLNMTIKDDGKGFDEATIIKGNGLNNMYSRAKEIKGTISIDAMEGTGTTVSLQCAI